MSGKKTKKQLLREQLQKDIADYLAKGKQIQQLAHNVSSWDEDEVKFMHKMLRNKSLQDEDTC